MAEARTELARAVARWRASPRCVACDDRAELLEVLGGLSAEQLDQVGGRRRLCRRHATRAFDHDMEKDEPRLRVVKPEAAPAAARRPWWRWSRWRR